MTASAERPRKAARAGPGPGSLLLRTAVPVLYGTALLACPFSPVSRPSTVLSVAVVLFTVHFIWRVQAFASGRQSHDLERMEVGMLAMLALATALEIAALPPPWPATAYAILIVALAGTVSFSGMLALPLATAFGAVRAAGGLPELLAWLPMLLQLELVAVAAGIVVSVEKRRSRKLDVALQKLRLDAEHLEARADGSGTEKKGDLSRLDDILYRYLQEVKENSGAHAAVLALKTTRGELYVRELVSDSANIHEQGILSLEGTAFQWILKNQKPLRTGRLSDPAARLGYYGGAVAVRSFLGVPVLEGEDVQGVLGIDSLREEAFSDAHLNMLKVASHQVATILTQIRSLEQVKREARDFKSLHEFSKRLGACGSIPDLLDLVLTVLRERVQPDFSAAALLGPEGRYTIEAVGAPTWAPLRGQTFDAEEGLAGWVATSRQYLHYGDLREKARRPLFAKGVKVPEFQSLLLHPLEAHAEALGVVCLGSVSARAFDPSAVAFCDILSQQTAQAILQIQSLEQLKQLAATDGLTSLANRRVFLDRLAEEVRRAKRYEHPLSLVILDIDHFKKINDRLGHPAGDEVLRGVARSLVEFARETDLVARYGGEEFSALLPNTDEPGARAVAERIRGGIEKLKVEWEGKAIPVRVSAGVATLEGESDAAEGLIARADQSLYAAKETGRNRVITYSDIREYASWK